MYTYPALVRQTDKLFTKIYLMAYVSDVIVIMTVNALLVAIFCVSIDGGDVLASRIVDLVSNCRLIRCDDVFPLQKISTYINYSLNQESCIDYVLVCWLFWQPAISSLLLLVVIKFCSVLLVSQGCVINNFTVLDPEINLSDHLPLSRVLWYRF